MGKDYQEKDFDDEVYEDDYYEEHYDEEELAEESDDLVEGEDKPIEGLDEEEESEEEEEVEEVRELEWDDEDTKRVTVSYACDECDYRWDDVVVKRKGLEEEEIDIVCPMCGSMNVTLI